MSLSASQAGPVTRPNRLPVTRDITVVYGFSLTIALLLAVASVIGLLYRTAVYPTDELLQSFVANDVVDLVIGLPILLGSMALARRGQLVGLLFWPGALFYVLYNSVGYVFSLPANVVFLLHLALVTLSAYTTIGLVASIDGTAVQERLAGAVPERLTGGVLAGLGTLFLLRATGVVVGALANHAPVAATDLAVLVSDFVASPTWIIGGVLLWRRTALGYVAGLGLVFLISMLFVGLIFFLLLQPILTAAPFALTDVVVVTIMGLVAFIPFGLFLRGAVRK